MLAHKFETRYNIIITIKMFYYHYSCNIKAIYEVRSEVVDLDSTRDNRANKNINMFTLKIKLWQLTYN